LYDHPPAGSGHRSISANLCATVCIPVGDVDPSRLKAADSEPQNWVTVGRDQNQTYYSPLAKINAGNVSRLGFAWTGPMTWGRRAARKRRRS
jgi:glucose dehydrogenase